MNHEANKALWGLISI